MAKFSVGQRVEIAFNPPTPDPRVPGQCAPWIDQKGRRHDAEPGIASGGYQTKPEQGEVLEVRECDGGACMYLVDVELVRPYERNGKTQYARSVRQRVIPEAKLRAVG
jgi:hypothetical protein